MVIFRNRIPMKVISCFLVFVLSTVIALYQWYYIGIPVVSVVLYEFVLTLGHGFLNQSLTVAIVRNRIDN